MRTESSPARTDGHHRQPSARSPLPGQRRGDGRWHSSSTRHCQSSAPASPVLLPAEITALHWQHSFTWHPTTAQVSTVPSGGCSIPPAPRAEQGGGCCLVVPQPRGLPGSITNHLWQSLTSGPLAQKWADVRRHLGSPVPKSVTSQCWSGDNTFGPH